jgi:arylsulfatase
MSVAIILSTDKGAPITIYQGEKAFKSGRQKGLELEVNIDLAKWEGQLVRFHIKGEVYNSKGEGELIGIPALSAELIEPTGKRLIEFAGWQKARSPGYHAAKIGSPAYVAPTHSRAVFVYGENGMLWHVLQVPKASRLKFIFRPLLYEALGAKHRLRLLESSSKQAFPPKQSSNPMQPAPRKADIFIYLMDSLRADHLSCYDYDRLTSPAIDTFARKATLFEHAYAASNWTGSSVASLLTGLYPSAHGIIKIKADKMPLWPELLPEVLRKAEYKTCHVVTNVNMSESFGFGRGVDKFAFKSYSTANCHWINKQVEDFLEKQESDQPVYIYAHTMEPHYPYSPGAKSFALFDRGFKGSCDGSIPALSRIGWFHPKLLKDDVEHLLDRYDADIFDNDAGFSEFIDILKRHNRFDNSLIILLADHGESFAEHDVMRHGHSFNQEELHVPLIIRFPKGRFAGFRVVERVSLLDIYPTILAEVGLDAKNWNILSGANLGNGEILSKANQSRQIYAEGWPYAERPNLACVIDEDGYKRVLETSGRSTVDGIEKTVGLWDTENDPKEQHNLIKSLPVRAAYDEQLIAQWLNDQRKLRSEVSAAGKTPSRKIPEKLEKELKSLGYIN